MKRENSQRENEMIIDAILSKKKYYMGIYVKDDDKANDRITQVVTEIINETIEKVRQEERQRLQLELDKLTKYELYLCPYCGRRLNVDDKNILCPTCYNQLDDNLKKVYWINEKDIEELKSSIDKETK